MWRKGPKAPTITSWLSLISLLLIPLCLSVSPTSFASSISMEPLGARSVAMGDTTLGLNTSNDVLKDVAAQITTWKRVSSDFHYAYTNRGYISQRGLSLVDSASNALAMGLAYFNIHSSLASAPANLQRVYLGIAYALGPHLAIGMSPHYLYGHYTSITNQADSKHLSLLNSHLSLSLTLPYGLSVGLVRYNLFKRAEAQLTPSGWGVGLGFSAQLLTVGCDVIMNNEKDTAISYHTGVEYFITSKTPLRLGYKIEPLLSAPLIPGNIQRESATHYLSAGVSFVEANHSSLELSYQHGFKIKENLWLIAMKFTQF